MIIRGVSHGSRIAAATDAAAFPVNTEPNVVGIGIPRPDASRAQESQQLVFEQLELVYRYEPTVENPVNADDTMPNFIADQFAKPVWLLYARSKDGSERYMFMFEGNGR